MDDTFTLKCGKMLHLKPLKPQALRHLILKFGCRVRDPQLRWTQIQDTIRAACTEAISLHKQWAYNKIKEYLEADRGSNNGIKDQTSDPVHQGD